MLDSSIIFYQWNIFDWKKILRHCTLRRRNIARGQCASDGENK
jgi:hypothetical protein